MRKKLLFWTDGFLYIMALAAAGLAGFLCQAAEPKNPQARPRSRYAWTYQEAQEQLVLNPGDVYLQYIVLQLARQEGRRVDLSEMIPGRRGPQREVDLLALFSAAHAIQESLQLESLEGRQQFDPARLANSAENRLSVSELHGSRVKSHPWEKMLAQQLALGKKAEVSPLSKDRLHMAWSASDRKTGIRPCPTFSSDGPKVAGVPA